jgi:hypothetical protein
MIDLVHFQSLRERIGHIMSNELERIVAQEFGNGIDRACPERVHYHNLMAFAEEQLYKVSAQEPSALRHINGVREGPAKNNNLYVLQ